MHVVKGHWGRYGVDGRKGKLFGRFTGRFWFEESERGNARNGIVEKDYKLSPNYSGNGIVKQKRAAHAAAESAEFAAAMSRINRDVQQPQRQEAK